MLLAAVLAGPATYAQRGGYGGFQYRYDNMQYDNSVLSIFSENGEPFYLVLNGMKQNLVPQSKIRVEALPKYQNDVQIMFTNGAPPIRRTVNIADPIDGRAVNLTLRISGGRSGMKLRFHRMNECDRNYRGPRDEYVMYYGKPQQVNTVTETSYMDPITGQWITETTTTTTTDNGYGGGYNNGGYNNGGYNNGGYNNGGRGGNGGYTPPPPPMPVAMDMRTFNDAKNSINGASFEDTKLSTAKTIFGANYMTTTQVMDICRLFSFENTKVTFAKFAYDRCVDPQNYFKVASVFDFDANKKALNDFISRGGR
ncbi:hypothetical protein GCM10023093_30810 [Nemorincola caseinilytica]|uniref:DUF4476 domain-containing protein n=1 Tax=Nemorincola caseinilytica TaxID=2054315 RepID=A0ABP8NNC9_9BACT